MTRALVPRWFLRTVVYAGGLLIIGAVAWALVWVLLKVAVVAFALLVSLLIAALLGPLARWLHRALPAWAAALLSVLFLLGVVGGIGYLLVRRVSGQLDQLSSSLTQVQPPDHAPAPRRQLFVIRGPGRSPIGSARTTYDGRRDGRSGRRGHRPAGR